MAICFWASPAAWAWGCKGHQTVAYIAEGHLTPKALDAVNQILKSNPIDPKLTRFCLEATYDLMADAATWADDERTVRPETGGWHFIDIPLGTAQKDLEHWCPQDGCIIKAIEEQVQILKSPESSGQAKGDALRFLIHFLGDMHQPLHTTSNDDRGGNCVPVKYFGMAPIRRDPTTENYTPNLHGVWDTTILERASDGAGSQELARELDRQFASQTAAWSQGASDIRQTVEQWVWESHLVAEQITYGKLPKIIPNETPQDVMTCADDNNIAERMLKLNEDLEQPYQDATVPVIRQQLEKGGLRLATLLNQLYDGTESGSHRAGTAGGF